MAQGYFTEDSMLRRVVSERVMVLAGARTLLMQAAHPLAFAGLMAHTQGLSDPYERLSRTAQVLNLIGFGTREEADRATRRVRAMHRRVRGALAEPAGRFPAGTPYAADAPELLLWILATLADSALTVYPRYVRALDRDERDALWRDYKVVGRLFGLAEGEMPEAIEDFDAYMRGMLEGDDLHVTDEARELAVEIVMRPPVPVTLRPVLEVVNQITIGLLPAKVRREFGFSWDPARHLALVGGAEYVKRVVVPLLPEKLRVIGVARAA
jgi:uncharacterized protein (DUF2236 family)